MAALQVSDYESFLKEWYQGTRVMDLVYKNHPYFGMVPKNANVRGLNYRKPVRYGSTAGNSSTFSVADANQAPAPRTDWVLTHNDNYSKASVSNKAIELSLDNTGSFRPGLQDAVDAAHSAFANDVSWELVNSDGTGARGTVSDASGAPVLVLAGMDTGIESRFFEVGMKVQYSADGGSTLADSGEERTVVAVNVGANTIELNTDFTSNIADTDILYRSGDFAAGRSAGLTAWLPGASVDSTPFFGVVRDVYPSRLAGVTGIKGTGDTPLTDSLINTAAAVINEGGSPQVALLASLDFAKLANETEQRGRYAKVDSTDGKISFSSLQIMTGSGAVDCVPEPMVSPDQYFLLDLESIELFSAGGLPRMFDKDGNFYHRTQSLDEISFYLYGFYGHLVQNPGGNSYVTDAY